MAAAFVFGQDVYLCREFCMWVYGSRFCQYLSSFDVRTVDPAEQGSDVVPCHGLVKGLSKHFYAGDYGLGRFVLQSYDFCSVPYFDGTAFYSACRYGAASGDGEYVFYRHQERFVGVTLRCRYVFVYGFHQVTDFLFVFRVPVQRSQCGSYDDRHFIAGEVIGGQQVADFHFYEVDQFRIVYLVCFVQEYDDGRYAYLLGKKDVFTGLGHWAVCCGYDQDRAVHLCRAGDHVLYIVGVPGAVYVCVVAVFGFIFYSGCIDGDTARSFFRCFIDGRVVQEVCLSFFSQYFGNGRGQGGFTVIDMSDSTDVYMRFGSFIMCFCHF